jgi:hypothetical protein
VRGAFAIGAGLVTVAVLAVAAGAAVSSDIYITGSVTARVAGKNAALVRIVWDYKCLGEDGGSYEWALKVVRQSPLPKKTTSLGSGTTERGEKFVRLTPGKYLPTSDPYACETDRGQGYDKPEIGATFVVPDYCAWVVSSTRGAVQLEHGISVKLAKRGSAVVPGDALLTPRTGSVKIGSASRNGSATLGGGSRLALDRRQCATTTGWKLALDSGRLSAAVPSGSRPRAGYVTVTPNAKVTATPGARWTVEYAKRRTKVKALAGTVRVGGKTLKAGQSTTV